MPKGAFRLTSPSQPISFCDMPSADLTGINANPQTMELSESCPRSESGMNSPQTLLQAAATRPKDSLEDHALKGAAGRRKNSPLSTLPQFGYPTRQTGSVLLRHSSLNKKNTINSAFKRDVNTTIARGASLQPALPSSHECLSSSEKEVLREAFNIFDRDRDGKLKVEEVRAACASLGITTSDEIASKLLSLGGWSDGLTFHDFVCLTSSAFLTKDEDDEVSSMFALFDRGNKGYITEEDLRAACDVCGASGTYSSNDLRLMVHHLDRDGSGKVYLSEFRKLFKKCAPLGARQ